MVNFLPLFHLLSHPHVPSTAWRLAAYTLPRYRALKNRAGRLLPWPDPRLDQDAPPSIEALRVREAPRGFFPRRRKAFSGKRVSQPVVVLPPFLSRFFLIRLRFEAMNAEMSPVGDLAPPRFSAPL